LNWKTLLNRKRALREFKDLQASREPVIGYFERTGHREGAGSLYQEAISARLLCDLSGKTLACPPIQYLHHYKSSGSSLRAYLKTWNNVFSPLGLHLQEKTFHQNLPFIENPKAMLDSLPESVFQEAVEKLRIKFPPRNPPQAHRKYTLAIHLRNLNPEDEVREQGGEAYGYYGQNLGQALNPRRNLDRLLNLQNYILREKKRYVPKGKKLLIQIISQGHLPGIQALEKKCDVEYALDEHPARSFRRMLEADLLVMASSSFSYLACLLRARPSWALKRFRHQLPANCQICEIF